MKPKLFILVLFNLLLIDRLFAQSARIKWLVPDEVDFGTEGITTEQSELDIKIDIWVPTGMKIQPGQVKLYRNNTIYNHKGEKLGNVPLKKTSESEFRLTQKVELLDGRNEWKVE